MSAASVSREVAQTQILSMMRALHRLTVGRRVSFSTFTTAVVTVGALVIVFAVFRCFQAGVTLAVFTGGLDSLMATIAFAAGNAIGAVALIVQVTWRALVEAERSRLAMLPLGRVALSLHSRLPALAPAAVGGTVTGFCLVVLALGARVEAAPIVGVYAAGLVFPVVVALVLRLLLLAARLSPVRARGIAAAGAVAGTIGMYAHAVAAVVNGSTSATPTPAQWVLRLEEPVPTWFSALALAGVVAVAAAALALSEGVLHRERRGVASTRPTRRRGRATRPSRMPPEVLLARTVLRRFAVRAEIAVAAVIAAPLMVLAANFVRLGRAESMWPVVLMAGLVTAYPAVGVRIACGPTARVVAAGMTIAQVRRAIWVPTLAAVGSVGVVGAGASVLVVLDPRLLGLYALASVLMAATMVAASSLLRPVLETSIGRSIALFPAIGIVGASLSFGWAFGADPVASVGLSVLAVALAVAALRVRVRRTALV